MGKKGKTRRRENKVINQSPPSNSISIEKSRLGDFHSILFLRRVKVSETR